MPYKPDEDVIKAQLATMKADQQTGVVALPRITAQQRYYVAARVGGTNIKDSAREVGVAISTASAWEKVPAIQQHMDHYLQEFTEKVLPRVQFGMEQAHAMYMNAYHSAGTSAEMTRATDSLVKLHGLLEKGDEQKALPTNVKQLETLDTQQLLRYAAIGMDSLQPGEIVDGEFTEED